jgi:hypothetical protein
MKALRYSSAVAIALLAAACGGSARTSPATQPGAFNAAQSDPKAVALADQMLAKLGGAANWDKVKQIKWEQRYSRDGKLGAIFRHAWDRWNGRHRFEQVDLASMEKAQREGRPEEVRSTIAMYELFDRQGKGAATADGQLVDTASRDKLVANAYKAWQADSYRLAAVYKVKDPGVKLSLKGQRPPVKGFCNPNCDVLEVTFAPEVGKDVWFINVNTRTRMPELIEKQMPDGKLGFSMTGWTQAGGLRFPTKFENLGAAEAFEIRDVQVGEPQDDLYIPAVTSTD